jgi:tRNA dimethylallyltransferase
MMEEGFLDEVARLHARSDLDAGKPSMRAVGYRQLWAHLDGRFSLDDAIYRALVATRQLAKRQMTWLRRHEDAIWCDPLDSPGIARMTERVHATLA